MSNASHISLRGIEFVVTYRGASQERRENLLGTLRYLNRTYSDYIVWLIEADASPTFSWQQLSDPKIRHVFVHDTGRFSRARLANLGARMCTGRVICIHDADMIANPRYMKMAVDSLMDANNSDAVCPFARVVNTAGELRRSFIESGDYDELAPFAASDEADLPNGMSSLYTNTSGALNVFVRAEFIRIGGFDPAFEGWGGEDDDLLLRATRLGVRWHTLAGADSLLFHMHHDTAVRADWFGLPEVQANRKKGFECGEIPLPQVEARAAALSKYFK
ncbi:Galactosyltransferase [Caballeronia pedi]|uniref:Galactosyltransferase n=1 Tax=Caballeronia pedi TaxID=1777141 RepID=A0A158DHJ7_9BURK|nr:galactosyltransferase-related protein [Caballeronia pedi]SAK94101.1 Galactosyltransferase [Caballeronia pedi]